MTSPTVPEDWWPDLLRHIPAEDPWGDDPVVVAESWQQAYEARLLVTALAPPELLDSLLSSQEGIGHRVEASGPHPSSRSDAIYRPHFWIWGGDSVPEGLKPLVVQWPLPEGYLLWPDQGFLMTYGLRPRVETSSDDSFSIS